MIASESCACRLRVGTGSPLFVGHSGWHRRDEATNPNISIVGATKSVLDRFFRIGGTSPCDCRIQLVTVVLMYQVGYLLPEQHLGYVSEDSFCSGRDVLKQSVRRQLHHYLFGVLGQLPESSMSVRQQGEKRVALCLQDCNRQDDG